MYYMFFRKAKHKNNIQISIGNRLIDKVNEGILLGVRIKLAKSYKTNCYKATQELLYIKEG